jgi:hypothetical protein
MIFVARYKTIKSDSLPNEIKLVFTNQIERQMKAA